MATACVSFRGTFKQGATPNLLLKITDFEGTPVDPSDITTTISGPTENISGADVVIAGTPFQADTGFYVYTWEIDSAQEVGTYLVKWEYVASGVSKTELQSINVVETIDEPDFYTERWIAIRDALEHHINCAQSIPVYSEQAKSSRDRLKFEFSFNNWNQSPGVKIYRNQNIINEGVDIDYFNGSVTFDDELLDQDVINADYNFKWFTDDALSRFIVNAIQTVNVSPPASGYDVGSLPNDMLPAVLYGAAKDAIRQLMMCIQFQQPAQIFGGPDEAQRVFGNLQVLKENYEKDWELLLEKKKYGPYPSSRTIVTPEYTLPGGRSRWFRYLFKG